MRLAWAYRSLARPSSALEPNYPPNGIITRIRLTNSVSVWVARIHGFIKRDTGISLFTLP